MVVKSLEWTVDPTASHRTICLKGAIDVNAHLEALEATVTAPTWFDLAEVVRINSLGAQQWTHFMAQIDGVGPHHLKRCSPCIVDQVSMIANFKGSAHIDSVMAPYFCPRCDCERLVEVQCGVANHLPTPTCRECGIPSSLTTSPKSTSPSSSNPSDVNADANVDADDASPKRHHVALASLGLHSPNPIFARRVRRQALARSPVPNGVSATKRRLSRVTPLRST